MKRFNTGKIAMVLFYAALIAAVCTIAFLGIASNSVIVRERISPNVKKVTQYSLEEQPSTESPIGLMRIYRWRVEDGMQHSDNMAAYAFHQYMRVYVGDELRCSIMPSEAAQFTDTLGSAWAFVPLRNEDLGAEIRVEVMPAYESVRERAPEFWVGPKESIIRDCLGRELAQIIIGMMICSVSLVFLVVGMLNYFRWNRGGALAAKGCFGAMLGIWRLCDTASLALLFPQTSVLSYQVSLFALMLCPMPLIKSLQPALHRKCRGAADACGIFVLLAFLVQLALQLLGVADIHETLALTHTALYLCAFTLLGCTIYSRLKNSREPGVSVGMLVICLIGGTIDVVLYYLRGDSSGLIGLMSAVLLYLILSGIQTMLQYGKQENAMIENRMAIMLSQIQPHFMFNSLTAIAQLCEKNPRLAKQTTISFAEYLRGNMDSLKQRSLIPFSREIEHLQRYISLEQLRFGEELSVEFDLQCTRFSLPALTVQPLVENAIKHGLGRKEGGGAVLVRSGETPASYWIEVRDDGVGFDPNAIPDDGRSHVGIRNVSDRLHIMCAGTLEIQSAPGEGACARITIPKSAARTQA